MVVAYIIFPLFAIIGGIIFSMGFFLLVSYFFIWNVRNEDEDEDYE